MEMAFALALLIVVILAVVLVGAIVQAAPVAYRFHAASVVLILAGAVGLAVMGWPLLWTMLLALGGMALVVVMMALQWAVGRWVDPWFDTRLGGPKPGHCEACGYDLRGNPKAVHCPECGAAVGRGEKTR